VQGDQGSLNSTVWRSADRVKAYGGSTLRPVEALLIAERRDVLAGRVLEVGCGAGRLTQHLAAVADRLETFDISPRMVAACALACPEADVREGDLRDLDHYPAAAYDAIWVGFNVIDILDHEERGRFVEEVAKRLAPDGVLVFSSHNLAAARSRRGPRALAGGSLRERAYTLARLPRRLRNHRRTAPFEYRAQAHAVFSDEENDFAGLHYYVGRDEQERQLRAHGFALLECRDIHGAVVPPGADALSNELHYVARLATTL